MKTKSSRFQSGISRRTVVMSSMSLLGTGMLGPGAARAAGPIKIGAILSVTSSAALLGDPEEKTIRLLVDQLNAQGGISGSPVELIIYDDASDAAKANTFMRRLVNQDQVDLIIGSTTTGSSMAMLPIAQSSRIPLICLGAGTGIVDPIKSYVFKIPHSDRLAAVKVLQDMKRRGIQRFALLSENGGYGKSGRDQTLSVAREVGMTIALDEIYGERDIDMTPQLTRVAASDAKAVFNVGTGQSGAIIARNYKQLGLAIPLYCTHGQASTGFIKLAGPAAEGIRLPGPALLIAEDLPVSDPQRKVCLEYKALFEAKYKTDVSPFGGFAYDAMAIAVAAIRRVGTADKDKLRAAIEETKGLVGVGGIYNMSPTDHNGLDPSAFRMVEIKNGRFREIANS